MGDPYWKVPMATHCDPFIANHRGCWNNGLQSSKRCSRTSRCDQCLWKSKSSIINIAKKNTLIIDIFLPDKSIIGTKALNFLLISYIVTRPTHGGYTLHPWRQTIVLEMTCVKIIPTQWVNNVLCLIYYAVNMQEPASNPKILLSSGWRLNILILGLDLPTLKGPLWITFSG